MTQVDYSYNEELLFKMSELFAVFADSTRIRIITLLRQKERNVSEIAESLGLSLSAISHQLKVLKTNDLVRSRKEGKYNIYYLSDDHVTSIVDMCREHLEEL